MLLYKLYCVVFYYGILYPQTTSSISDLASILCSNLYLYTMNYYIFWRHCPVF